MDFLYQQFVAGKQKAIVAFVVTAVTAYAAKHGVDFNMTLAQVVEAVMWGLLGLVTVYVKRNKH